MGMDKPRSEVNVLFNVAALGPIVMIFAMGPETGDYGGTMMSKVYNVVYCGEFGLSRFKELKN